MLPVIPGAVGFGMETEAGRGGRLCVVTSIEAEGPGTLREALELAGPRTIVFDVAGTIDLVQPLVISRGHVRIAGQTAPAPGITIVGAGVIIEGASDVVLQHLRIRVGDRADGPAPKSRDGLQIYDAQRVIVDHCSISWAMDENVDIWTGVSDVTIRNCIIAEGLIAKGRRPDYPDGHSCAMRVGPGAQRVLVDRCLFAHNNRRSPLITGGCSVIVGNCVIYNPGSQAIGLGGAGGEAPIAATLVDNALIRGRNTPAKLELIRADNTANPASQIFAARNAGSNGVGLGPGASVQIAAAAPVQLDGYKPIPITTLAQFAGAIFASCGARPAAPDATDRRLLGEALVFGGSQIDSQNQREGLPVLALPDPTSHSTPDGYSDLENVLNSLRT